MDKIAITIDVNVSRDNKEGNFAKRIVVPDDLMVYLNYEALGMETARMIDKALADYKLNNKETK